MAELIKLPFGTVSGVRLRNRVLGGHAHWYHLANMVKQLCKAATSKSATKGGDAVCLQITLSNYDPIIKVTVHIYIKTFSDNIISKIL